MKRKCFTLVELLAVIAIIGILAGILIPTLGSAQLRGKITQAKSDMKTIETALEAFAADNGGRYCTNTTWATAGDLSGSTNPKDNDIAKYTTNNKGGRSCGIIQELCDPGKVTPNNNKRKIRYLEPSSAYVNGNSEDQLWPDPWGNSYNIWICMDNTGKMTPHASHNVYSNVILWSNGPDGENNDGKNSESDSCGSTTPTDDVASWHK
ncbi:MAG: prepilin-type N-terminal cleavage/methylation domain-containing protein [Victivallaceae bacterium]|nr:prepilin-type N-terminal cleavage/methylation domain-containing protein [Victivallaceae bacterium]